MDLTPAAGVPRPDPHSSAVTVSAEQSAEVAVDAPQRLTPPSSDESASGQFEDSAILWIIVIGMAVIVVAAAFLLSTL
jgi:hypothetical protein